jgi:hypothetical protein
MSSSHAFLAALLVTIGIPNCKNLGSRDEAGGASTSAAATTAPTTEKKTPTAPAPSSGAGGAGVVGVAGIAAWDGLSTKAGIQSFPTLYLHQSVGQDLEDGAADVGHAFTYYGPSEAPGSLQAGLHGGLFADVGPVDNGKPLAKINVVRRELQKQKGKLRVLAFSFGYADVMDTVEENGTLISLDRVFAEYKKLVDEAKAAVVRFVHVTPPLVFDPSTNAPKMKMRKLMLHTFKSDVIFDLQDIESLDNGKRCERGGVWQICQANRSTSACPSKGQGVDTDGQGHLCSTKAAQFSKALLYALYSAAM